MQLQSEENMKFEESMKRLDEIVKQMETGDLSLEESMKLYEEATKLSALCKDELEKAELKITELKSDGEKEDE